MGIRALLSNIESSEPAAQEEVVRELSHTVANIPIEEIEVNPFQPRKDFDETALQELAESLKVHGLIQPITVRRLTDKQYQLISGERRLRASRIAGLTEVPAYIRLADDQQMLEMALVENIQREELNPIEIAITYQRLIDECSLTHESLSDRVGKKRPTITNFLSLLKLPPEIQQALKEGNISTGHAKVLKGINDFGVQSSLFRETVTKQLSVRELEDLARKFDEQKTGGKKGKKPSLPDEYVTVQSSLRKQLGARVVLKRSAGGKGQIVIPFSNDNDLNRLLDLIEK